MDKTLHSALLDMAEKALRPIIRLLVMHGMTEGTFTELSRRLFVEESAAQLRATGEKATVSAISALTGLSRKEVKRQQMLNNAERNEYGLKRNRAVQVLSAWCNDEQFCDAQGPRVLPITGEHASFAALVKQYSGDVTPVAMLSLLKNAGNIVQTEDTVELVSQAYLPMQTPMEKLDIFGTDGSELLSTIAHNITADTDARFFQRKVSTTKLRADAVEDFKSLSNRQSMELLKTYDAWLGHHETTQPDDPNTVYVAVGIYYFQNPKEGEQ